MTGVIVAVLVTLGAFLVVRWRSIEERTRQGQADLDAAIAETDVLDPRWRWEQMDEDRLAIAADHNSARVVTGLQDRVARNQSSLGSFLDQDRPANRLLGDAHLDQLEWLATTHAEAIALVVTLRDFPEGRAVISWSPDFISTKTTHADDSRTAVWLLEIDAERQMYEHRAVAVAGDIHATLHAGALLRGEPGVMVQLMRILARHKAVAGVERLLGMSEPDEPTLARLQAHLAAEMADRPIAEGLRGERAGMNRLLDGFRSGDPTLARSLEGIASKLPGYVSHEHAEYLRRMNRAIVLAGKPFVEQPVGWAALEKDEQAAQANRQGPLHPKLVNTLLVNLPAVGDRGVRDHAYLACGSVALAVERFRRAKQRWPESLAELLPAYLPAVPVDPYTGKPLLYKHFPDGVAVYSVGPNGVDDGGVILTVRDFRTPEADLGVRLWDPPRRRLPPPEEDIPPQRK
jgi:hypothetical protein